MTTFTARDMRDQIIRSIEPEQGDFDVDGILDALQARYGTCNIDDIPSDDYWATVQAHVSEHPCAAGCSDPERHAEGGHDA